MKLSPAQAEARRTLGRQYRDAGIDPDKLAAELGTTRAALGSWYQRRRMWDLAYYVRGPRPLTGTCPDCGRPMRDTSTRCVGCNSRANIALYGPTPEQVSTARRERAAAYAANRIDTVQELHDIGRSPHDAIAASGTNGRALERWLQRHGRHDLAVWVHGGAA